VVNFGQIICGLIAVDPITAQDAVKLIHVQYEELKPIITIEVFKILNRYVQFDQTKIKMYVMYIIMVVRSILLLYKKSYICLLAL